MNNLITMTIQLEQGNDEERAYLREELEKCNLRGSITGSGNMVFCLPEGTFVGTFEGEDIVAITDDLLAKAKHILDHCNLNGLIYISSGRQWVWRGIKFHK